MKPIDEKLIHSAIWAFRIISASAILYTMLYAVELYMRYFA